MKIYSWNWSDLYTKIKGIIFKILVAKYKKKTECFFLRTKMCFTSRAPPSNRHDHPKIQNLWFTFTLVMTVHLCNNNTYRGSNQTGEERPWEKSRIALGHDFTECYNPNFFENQVERLAITNPAKTCSTWQKNIKLIGLHCHLFHKDTTNKLQLLSKKQGNGSFNQAISKCHHHFVTKDFIFMEVMTRQLLLN